VIEMDTKVSAAESQKNVEQWQSDVLLLRDHMLLANERQMNKSRDRLQANERRQWITSTLLAGSKASDDVVREKYCALI
jgi:hypothetical protein